MVSTNTPLVTHLRRREGGRWRIVRSHGVEVSHAPAAAPQRL